MRKLWYRSLGVAVAAAVALAACGGDSTEAGGDAESGVEAVAEANLDLLEAGTTILDHQVLDVADGSIATLGETVDGDRPVLLWFFSPH